MIEQLIQNLTDALNRNTAALTGEPVIPGANAAPEAAPRGRGRPPKAAASPEPVAAVPTETVTTPVAAPATVAAPASQPAVSASSPVTLTYKQVVDVLGPLAEACGRDALVALLKKYGADTVPAVKDTSYAAIVADAQALIAAKTATPASPTAGLI